MSSSHNGITSASESLAAIMALHHQVKDFSMPRPCHGGLTCKTCSCASKGSLPHWTAFLCFQAMGQGLSAPPASAEAAMVTTGNVDPATGKYFANGPWQPGPPSIVDLCHFIPGDPFWWSVHCSTPGCQSWLWVEKTRLPQFQQCTQCQQPWIQSFLTNGANKWHDGPPDDQQ